MKYKKLSNKKQKEIIAFISERTKELEKWNKDIDELLKKVKKIL